ncbi:MAG: glycosyl hydrolase 115 family protein [bacterium]
MRHTIRTTRFLLLVVALSACASNRTAESNAKAPSPNRNVLSGTDLREQHFNTAYDAIEALRSNWLQTRGPDSFQSPSIVIVYLDNVKLGGVETLRAIELTALRTIEHFDGTTATARWGVGHGGGVILISTIGKDDPHAPVAAELSTAIVAENAPVATDGFALASGGRSTSLLVSSQDYTGVIRVVNDLRVDVGRVTGKEPAVVMDAPPGERQIVIVGTIGKSPIIDRLVQGGKLDVTGVKGKWESYVRQVVANPLPGVEQALVIAGSDKRGTIYGVYDVSARIGVSPWHYWADVPTRHRADVFIPVSRYTQGEPAVKYRGIFINDEAPAFSGWTREKFGGVNHEMYTKMFELILRMKGNYLWPAMWGNAFADDDSLNARLADEYGIVMGTSHHEPMTRAQQEWRRYGKGAWDYGVNDTTLRSFWRQGIERMGSRENIVTLGMRGDGDRPMTTNGESNIALLEKIVADQRKILGDVTGKDPSKTPTLWALYKEVQDYYDKGMRVPDDVTLLFSDDNWGDIRRLPAAQDRNHSGGFGVYYHFDYVGGPRNYKWLNTNPIARVWEQMHLANEYGANRIWIVNVGDLKPMEFPIQFFLDYAWNPSRWPAERLPDYTRLWAEQQFGGEHAGEIADVVTRTLKYAARRKPELLTPETYSLANYREAETVVGEYEALVQRAEQLSREMPAQSRDAFYELVLHPVLAMANLNAMYVTVAQNRLYAQQGRASTNDLAQRARALFEHDAEISRVYNTELAGGKWSHMMDQTHIGYTYWQEPPRNMMPRVDVIQVPAAAEMGVAYEGQPVFGPPGQGGPPPAGGRRFSEPAFPEFDAYRQQVSYVDVYNKGLAPFDFTVQTGEPWVVVSAGAGHVEKEQRISVRVDWSRAPIGMSKVPVTITGPDARKVVVQAIVRNPASPRVDAVNGFVESNGVVSMEAEHFSRSVGQGAIQWLRVPDLGRTLSGMTPSPVDAKSQTPAGDAPHLEYRMVLFDSGAVNVRAYLSPTLNFSGAPHGVRYAVSLDDKTPQIINATADSSLKTWEQMVGDNINIVSSKHQVAHPGEHVLKFWMVDPGIVLQKLVLDAGGLKPSYLGPPESFYARKEVAKK